MIPPPTTASTRFAGLLAANAARSDWPSRAGVILALAAIYFATARLGLLMAIPGGHVTPVWPPSGIALAALLLMGRHVWPGIWLGSFAANLWDFYGSPMGPFTGIGMSALFGAGASLTALLGERLLRQFVGARNPLEQVRDVCAFMAFGGALSCLLGATIGVTALCGAGFTPWTEYERTWLTWWLGDTAGVFVVTPLVLAWSRPTFVTTGAGSPTFASGSRWLEMAGCFGLLLAVTYFVFVEHTTRLLASKPLTFILIPFLVWPAVRFGARGAATAVALIAMLAVWGTIHGTGPFNIGPRNESLLLLALFVSVVVLTALCISAIVAERQRAEAAQQQALGELEDRVQARTAELQEANLILKTEIAERQRAREESIRLLAETERARSVLLSLLEDQKLAEASQRKLGERIARAQQVAHLGFIDWDLRTNDVYLSAEVYRLYGLDPTSTMNVSELIANSTHPEDTARTRDALQLAIQGVQPYNIEHRIVRPDGEVRWMHAQAELVRDADGQPLTLLGTVQDITARKWAEAAHGHLESQLREAQKMDALGTLAGGIAHDFNNILGAILGNVALARGEPGTPQAVGESLDEIAKASQRAKSLIDQILTFSRRQTPELTNQPLQPLLEETIKLLRATVPAGVRFELALAATPVQARVNASQVSQVLINLCTNAWHALKDGAGHVGLTLDVLELDQAPGPYADALPPGRYARIRVRDDGCGMDAATQARVFEPFFTTKTVGTGLGLAVVHGIVKAHHGTITLTSAPGVGSVFEVLLPASDAPTSPAATAAAPPRLLRGEGRRVLYLDDDEAMVFMVTRMLARRGFQVSGFEVADEALAALRANPADFDLVVTDFNMPKASGLDVARAIARIRPGLPVVITSGYITDALREGAREAGVRHLVYKPNSIEELVAAIAQLLELEVG